MFCKLCLQKYCEQTVFGLDRSTIRCMSTDGEECQGFYSDNAIRAALSEKAFLQYSQALTRDALRAAELDSQLVTCAHCSMQMLMDNDYAGCEFRFCMFVFDIFCMRLLILLHILHL